MRSQASKTSPKKGELSKTHPKTVTPKIVKKKKVPAKKVKKIVSKTLVKQLKKSSSKDDSSCKNNEETVANKVDTASDSAKPGPSKLRIDSSVKKNKIGAKEKKDTVKTITDSNTKKAPTKKGNSVNNKKVNPKCKLNKGAIKNDTKYKTNRDAPKKVTKKVSKAKNIVKKADLKKKSIQIIKQTNTEKDETNKDNNKETQSASDKKDSTTEHSQSHRVDAESNNQNNKEVLNVDSKTENKNDKRDSTTSGQKNVTSNQVETPKVEIERPPKFFTSTRSPRTVDIDVKCLKNSKGNLSVSERFLSMKLETKNEDNSKDKNVSNTLISQGPEIDVYTFTEKVDSPKNILSDFRSPVNKNIGRVRPIARVKGTVIDKKTESEKKKYSPHRPIEEVVKQLKANKRSEEVNSSQSIKNASTTCSLDKNDLTDIKGTQETPKPIVSKSYKMVARKSSVTGKPFSPIHFIDSETAQNKEDKPSKNSTIAKKAQKKTKKQTKKDSSTDDELDTSKFSLSKKPIHHSSSEESASDSNDDDDTKDSSDSDTPKTKKTKLKKYKRIMENMKTTTSKELKELSKDSLVDMKDECALLGGDKPSKRRLKLLSMWTGPKKHRMASLNAIAKVHCLYENENRTHMELGLMKTVDRQILPSTSKTPPTKKKDTKTKDAEKHESSTSESEYESKPEKKNDSSDSSDDSVPQRTLRGVPGIRSAGKYWDPKSSSSSSEDSEFDTKKKSPEKKKVSKPSSGKSDSDKPPAKMKKTAGVPVKKKRNRNEVVMDLKDMVVQKRMASLNASAILAASYEKRSPKSNKDETTSDSGSDESFSQSSKNGVASGVKSETKCEETKKEGDESQVTDRKQKVEVIVNQDTDVTITGVYSTHHHEGFCTVSGMQYRISSTSHTQTTATANCEKEGCSKEDGARYTPLSALSSMQPPAEHNHPHPVPEIGGLARRAGCSSAFSAPSPAAHHEPGYYQPAGPLIKESSADAERALARYHPQPHYHAPHPSMLQQYGPPYYPDLCYGRYYRPPGPYHMPPPQPDAQMVGVGSEPYPPSQYYGTPPCYQHSPQRIPYVEYRCPCPLNACPKNVLIGPVTGKAPTGSGPADLPSALVQPGGAFRPKVRACAPDTATDTHGSGKDPPLEPEPPAAAGAPHPCPLPAIGGASPKRELYDIREKLRIAGPPEALGPPSPARGSAGVCAPQPPPVAPRRARLGKDMARKSLARDDTGLLLSAPRQLHTNTTPTPSDADDDVLAISPPVCGPIDLSSSDERTTPLVDVKKENEGPTYASARNPEAQALKEHNNCVIISDPTVISDGAKAVKRRYSRPKLEIDMKDSQLEDVCLTNGIGEHVKLQKRRKVSSDHSDNNMARTETITKEPKKRTPKKLSKTPTDKKSIKRKRVKSTTSSSVKKILLESKLDDDLRSNHISAIDESQVAKPKTKSAQLLDNLLRKNSIERLDAKKYTSDGELDPAELFLSPNENVGQNKKENDDKKTNINNNVLENTVNGVRPNTIAAVTQLIEKKLALKNACKLEKVDSKVTHSIKSVLEAPIVKSEIKAQIKPEIEDKFLICMEKDISKSIESTDKVENKNEECCSANNIIISDIPSIPTVTELSTPKTPNENELNISSEEIKDESQKTETKCEDTEQKNDSELIRQDRSSLKRCKLTKGKMKRKNTAKLLISKRPAIKTDEATQVIEEACASPTPSVMFRGKTRRRGCGGSRRGRRPRSPLTLLDFGPKAPPRWSNGWRWDGRSYVSRVYVNNSSRHIRTARCWPRMTHESGDSVSRGDCVLLRASVAKAQPFVAKVASLWENPDDGEMMVSLVWYYRPEHTQAGRQPEDAPDEVFASRHRDSNSVACIEDKCYVLNLKEYSRYRKRLKAIEAEVPTRPSIVPPAPPAELVPGCEPADVRLPPSVSPELVLFCRKIYDFRSKRIHVSNK